MARSSWQRIAVVLAGPALASGVLACNGILGLGDYSRAECSGGELCDDAGGTDRPVDAGSDVVDGSRDAGRGSAPVSWARWRMPNYGDGGPNPMTLFVEGDTVKDDVTKLVWRRKPEADGAPRLLDDAIAACRNAPAGPWRLPKRIELVSLLHYGNPTDVAFVDQTAFPDVPAVRFWTSSEVRPFDGGADQAYWVVNFDTGRVETRSGGRTGEAAALCVKAQ